MDALVPQDRVEHVGVIDPFEEHGALQRGDPAGEAPSERDSHALADLFLDAARGGRHQVLRGRIQQQHRGGVHGEQLADPLQQLTQQLVEVELRQPGVGHRLQAPQAIAESHIRALHGPDTIFRAAICRHQVPGGEQLSTSLDKDLSWRFRNSGNERPLLDRTRTGPREVAWARVATKPPDYPSST